VEGVSVSSEPLLMLGMCENRERCFGDVYRMCFVSNELFSFVCKGMSVDISLLMDVTRDSIEWWHTLKSSGENIRWCDLWPDGNLNPSFSPGSNKFTEVLWLCLMPMEKDLYLWMMDIYRKRKVQQSGF